MADVQVYYNPRCSKCRRAKELLDERDVDYELIEYLRDPPSVETLTLLLAQLGVEHPRSIVRSKEAKFAELGLAEADHHALLAAAAAHPELLERPIVVRGDRAVVARPPEALLQLL